MEANLIYALAYGLEFSHLGSDVDFDIEKGSEESLTPRIQFTHTFRCRSSLQVGLVLAWLTNYLGLQVVSGLQLDLGQVLYMFQVKFTRATSVLYVHLEIAYYTVVGYADICSFSRVFTYIMRFNESWKLQFYAKSQYFVAVIARRVRTKGSSGVAAKLLPVPPVTPVPVACLGSFREKQCRRWPIG